jgi:hypothetical protein
VGCAVRDVRFASCCSISRAHRTPSADVSATFQENLWKTLARQSGNPVLNPGRVGTRLLLLVPSPTWPSEFNPQHHRLLSVRSAQVCAAPVTISLTDSQAIVPWCGARVGRLAVSGTRSAFRATPTNTLSTTPARAASRAPVCSAAPNSSTTRAYDPD